MDDLDRPLNHIKFDWLAEGAIPITREEAEASIFKKVPTPVFKLVKGPNVRIGTLPMLTKENVSVPPSKAVPAKPELLRNLCPFRNKAKNIPMFSFCVNGMVYACVLDVESGVPLFKVREALNGFTYFAYNSVSCEIERPRFRVVIPFSEPVEAEVFDYCKTRLHEAFAKIADIHSFESSRFFFLPTRFTGPFNEANILKGGCGSSLDFMKTTGFSEEDRLQMQANKLKHQQLGDKDVKDDERVQYYLTTDFPLMRGNGDSASSFYTAICVCLANGDEETLEEVLDKARSENWSEKEIRYNIKQAKKFLKI